MSQLDLGRMRRCRYGVERSDYGWAIWQVPALCGLTDPECCMRLGNVVGRKIRWMRAPGVAPVAQLPPPWHWKTRFYRDWGPGGSFDDWRAP